MVAIGLAPEVSSVQRVQSFQAELIAQKRIPRGQRYSERTIIHRVVDTTRQYNKRQEELLRKELEHEFPQQI